MGKTRQISGLLIVLVICYGIAAVGAAYTLPAVMPGGWYTFVPKPAWTPPSWVFGPVWTILYTMMGVAAWLVWRQAGRVTAAAAPLALFTIQLLFNLAWTLIFFGQHLPGVAFLDIIFLWLAILATLLTFRRLHPLAGWLLLPYLLWVTYATALNYSIWRALGL